MARIQGALAATPSSSEKQQGLRAVFAGLSSRGSSRQTSDLRDLLWRRLRGIVMIALGTTVFLVARSFGISIIASRMSANLLTFSVVSLLLLILLNVALWRDRGLSVQQLRRIEVFIVGLLALGNSIVTVTWLGRGTVIDSLLSPEHIARIQGHFWVLSAQSGIYLPAGFQAFQGIVGIRWCIVIVLYGVVIPNTWRRCAQMMAVVILLAVGSILISAWRMPALWPHVGLLLSALIPTWIAFAAIGLFGCHKLSDLHRRMIVAQQIGQYQLERRLGGGGMGEVYLARHRMLRRPCAVKLIRADQAGSLNIVARFEREVQTMAQLTHPNTVEIFDYGRTDDGMFYYVMEYLPGTTLEMLIRRHGPLPAGRVVFLLQQVCRALHEAHVAGLIHRDIKPSNIFLCERGGEHDRIKLLDFGLVQVTGGAEPIELPSEAGAAVGAAHSGDLRLTQVGHIMGTPAYISPEQVLGQETDPRSDIYSLGAVAYYLLSGQPPFRRATTGEIYSAHVKELPRPPSERQVGVPQDLESVVLRCLSKERTERYANTQELESALLSCACAPDWDDRKASAWWQSVGQSGDAHAEDPSSSAQLDEKSETIGTMTTDSVLEADYAEKAT